MKLIIFTLFLSLLIVPALGDINPITNFQVVTDVPSDMVAGSLYQAEYSFSSTHNTNINISFVVLHNTLNSNEWLVNFFLNDNLLDANETYPGIFINSTPIAQGDHVLNITIQSLPAIVPADYNYSVVLLCENIYVAPEKSSSGRSHYPIPTPTIAPNKTAIVGEDGVIPTPTPINITAEQIQEPSRFSWGTILAIISCILALLLAGLIKRRRKDKDNQP